MSILKVGFVASIPALFGFAGGVLGGLFSDYLIGRGCTLTLRVSCPLCWECCWRRPSSCSNYTASTPLVITLMALAFFGKGFGALGWPVISDVAPKGDCWPVRRGIQRLWQCGLDRHAAGYWLHRERTALI